MQMAWGLLDVGCVSFPSDFADGLRGSIAGLLSHSGADLPATPHVRSSAMNRFVKFLKVTFLE